MVAGASPLAMYENRNAVFLSPVTIPKLYTNL
jgi:hypothetical protein